MLSIKKLLVSNNLTITKAKQFVITRKLLEKIRPTVVNKLVCYLRDTLNCVPE